MGTAVVMETGIALETGVAIETGVAPKYKPGSRCIPHTSTHHPAAHAKTLYCGISHQKNLNLSLSMLLISRIFCNRDSGSYARACQVFM